MPGKIKQFVQQMLSTKKLLQCLGSFYQSFSTFETTLVEQTETNYTPDQIQCSAQSQNNALYESLL